MVTVIEGKFGIGYRQSPYLFNNFGFKAEISEGNSFGGITVKSNYIEFFENYVFPKKKCVIVRKNPLTKEDLKKNKSRKKQKKKRQ